MTPPRVLVTTPNGRTGSAAVHELLRRGFRVRGLVRADDARAARWRALGVETVVGSLHDWRDLQRAVRDVQRAYHCPPFDARHLHAAMMFSLAAEEAGVEVVAMMSGWNAHPTHPSILQRETWMANSLYRRAAFDVIHINPGMFAFTYLLGLPAIEHFGVLALPFGEGENAPPSSEDIGAVAAGALADPDRWVGQCLRPMGPALLSGHDVAEILEGLLDRRVRYRPISTRMFARIAEASGFPRFNIAQVVHYASEHAAGAYAQSPNTIVQDVVGRPAEDFETSARRDLAAPARIWPGMTRTSWWEALALGMRIAVTRTPDLPRWESTRDYPTIRDGQLAHESAAWRSASKRGQLVLQPDPPPRPQPVAAPRQAMLGTTAVPGA